jgi:Cdc6-like AAA superfamily ATPase
LLTQVKDALRKYDHVFFLVDDIHHVSDLESFLYLLTKTTPADREYSFGSVLTSVYSNTLESVDQRILDHMGATYLSLSSPSPEEVTRVLEDRIQRAFEPDSITPEAKEFLATETARYHGNLRTALIWLARAAVVAEDADVLQITKTHIEEAIAKHLRKLGVEHLHDFEFNPHQQAILAVLLEATHSDENQLAATDIYDRYIDIMVERDLESLSYGQFRENLKGMHHPEYVSASKEPQDKGPAQWEATLECDPRIVATYLDECGSLTGYESLVEVFDPRVLYREGTPAPPPSS